MPDTKASALVALAGTATAPGDLLYVVDVSAGSSGSKTVRADGALTGITNATVLPSGAVVPNTLIVQQAAGTPGTDQVNISHSGTAGLIECKDGLLQLKTPSDYAVYTPFNTEMYIQSAGQGNVGVCLAFTSGGSQPGVRLRSNGQYEWTADATEARAAADTGLQRVAAGVVGPTNGAASPAGRWLQNTAGDSRVNGDLTNATTTPTNITGLASTLVAGRKYGFELTLKCSTDQAAEGIRFDLDGGTATVTSLAGFLHLMEGGTTVLGTVVTSALATDMTATTITGETWIKIAGALVADQAGTFIPRFAQSTHAAGTATLSANSTLRMWDIP